MKYAAKIVAKLPSTFVNDNSGASLVEYSVALIVVTLVGAVIFGLGNDIAAIIFMSAGAF